MHADYYMKLALNAAHNASHNNEVPIGAVIVNPITNVVVAIGYNQVITNNNPCLHAEIVAIQNAGKILNNYRLTGLDLYVTLEPCLMCVGAIIHARINRVFFGATDSKGGAIVSNTQLAVNNFNFNHRPQYVGGILAQESAHLLKQFFKLKRLGSTKHE